MTLAQETWSRIEEANIAAGWFGEWTLAERDQIEALADDLNRELLAPPAPVIQLRPNAPEGSDIGVRHSIREINAAHRATHAGGGATRPRGRLEIH